MPEWLNARAAWLQVQDDILDARREAGCQVRSAWFRGLSDTRHQLLPSIFRNERQTALKILQAAGLSKTHIYKSNYNDFKLALDRAVVDGKLAMQHRKSLSKLIEYIENRYAIIKKKYADNKEKRLDIGCIELRINIRLSAILAEIDAYHEFQNRAQMDTLSSWDVLAQMRHRSVPTRLLDWTESCQVALHFALKDYLDEFIPRWSKEKWLNRYPAFPDLTDFRTPALWVMNPFHLADLSGIKGAIPYPNHPPLPDYYNAFLIGDCWPYERAIPIRAPRADKRMEAQRGNFTVHGFDTRPVDLQLSSGVSGTCLRKIKISKEAAIYGALYLWQIAHYDEFDLMKDNDTLGKVVTDRHLPND